MNEYIEIGKITGFFGVKGWVKLYSHSRPRVGIGKYQHFYYGSNKSTIEFTNIKESGKNIVGHIKDIDSREAAEQFIGQILFIQKKDLPKLENEYYWSELIGLTVINHEGLTLGRITEMMETGANDVVVVHSENEEETLIPFAMSHFIDSIDIEKGEMRVNWEIDENEEA
ncbi:MAG: 16S rRNA processing protein RimM [Gammaproteobacteria bacterium]|nr:16S rRNA processing protein RimM [Gammaproteobacteria bacterium]